MITKIKNFFLSYAVLFLIAAVTSFTAYNWKLMNNYEKLSIPSLVLIVGLGAYIYFKKEIYKNLALFFSCFMIGILFATFGQVYQTGADSYTLFRSWAIFLVLPVIITMSYPIFLLLIVIINLMSYFYLTIFLTNSESLYITTLISTIIIIAYPLIIEKLKIKFNNIFYNSLVIPFYTLFNISGIFVILENRSYYYFKNLTLYYIVFITFPLVIALLYFICSKIYKKSIILPFSIISAGIFICLLFTKIGKNLLHHSLGWTIYFLVITGILIGTLVVLKNNIPALENKFIEKIFKYVLSFLKIFIAVSVIGIVAGIVALTGNEEASFLIIGILLTILSFYLPKILAFKERKLEIISFAVGALSLNLFFASPLGSSYYFDNILLFATLNIIAYNIVWFFRKNKAMDLLFMPTHYAYILVFLHQLGDKYEIIPLETIDSHLIFLSLIGLLLLPLQLIFEKKIENLECKDQLNRIFYGNNIFLTFLLTKASYNFDYRYDTGLFVSFIEYSREILVILLSVFVIIFAFGRKLKEKIKNKDFKNIFIREILIFSILILTIQYFSSYIDGVKYIILFVLLYIYKKDKWTTYLLNMLLCAQVFAYYFAVSEVSLLEKSIDLFVLYGVMLGAYLVTKIFVRELGKNEE